MGQRSGAAGFLPEACLFPTCTEDCAWHHQGIAWCHLNHRIPTPGETKPLKSFLYVEGKTFRAAQREACGDQDTFI